MRSKKLLQEFIIGRLLECQANDDTEDAHFEADEILCNLLEELGYGDVVAEYRKVDKWFA